MPTTTTTTTAIMKLPATLALTAMVWSAALPLHAAAFDAASAAALIAKNQAALVEIHATLSIKPELIDGPPGISDMINQQPAKEQPVTANGVVIRNDGLVAVPLALLDPGTMMGDGLELDTPLGKLKIGLKTNLTAVKVVTADGHDYPAEVLLKEATAGLALLKITTPPAAGMTAVSLTKDLPVPPPFAQVCGMARLKADFGLAPTVRLLRVGTLTPPPTPMLDITGMSEPGTASFDQDGRFIGITVMPSRGKAGGMPDVQFFILPLSEIQRLSAKALP